MRFSYSAVALSRRASTLAIAIASFALSSSPLLAQRIESQRVGIAPLAASISTPRSALPPAPSDVKDPFTAGVLSFLLPGAGSFYAGNEQHGWMHMGITAGAIGAVFLTNGDCSRSCPSKLIAGLIAIPVLLANDLWSVNTAVSDAEAANRAARAAAPEKP